MIRAIFLSVFMFVYIFSNAQSNQNIKIKRSASPTSKSSIQAFIHERDSEKMILMADIWIGKKRYPADSSGKVIINDVSGKVKLTARGFNYQSITHSFNMNKDEIVEIHFYLNPFVFQN